MQLITISRQRAVPGRICNYDRRYSRRARVVYVDIADVAEISYRRAEAINREIYVDKFDNISREIESRWSRRTMPGTIGIWFYIREKGCKIFAADIN